ncbi:MAG TPA: N-acetylmuramoyl-L-alanine amidase [Candidatus Acidoferrum sp.]|jgi:N-acetylmuramoyl-L-alanine amidase
MKSGSKNFHKSFAVASLGFTLLSIAIVPHPILASSSNNTPLKRDAASSQFGRAEELRETLNTKPADKRTLAEYKQVVISYRRVYMITPHATQVPEALVAVGELNTEMGDHFGQSYYQAAVESYQFLLREYPTSKFVPDVMLRVAKLQKNQLNDVAGATKSFQDFQKKYPHSPRKREVQEELAELALMKSAETGQMSAKNWGTSSSGYTAPAPMNTPALAHSSVPSGGVSSAVVVAPAREEAIGAPRMEGKSGGEDAKSGVVPRVQHIRTSVTQASTEVIIDLDDSVQYVSGRIANPDRIYFDLQAAKLSTSVARGNVAVSGELLTKVRVAQNQFGIVRVVLDVNGVQDYSASIVKKPTRLVIELYGGSAPVKQDAVQTAKAVETPKTKTIQKAPAATSLAETHPVELEDPSALMTPAKPAVAKEVVSKDVLVTDNSVASTPATLTSKPSAASPNSKTTKTSSSKNSTTKPDLVQPATIPTLTRDGQSTLTRALGLKIGRIVIDAGHGGHDTGTIGPTGLMEKDLCLDVALRLGKLIQQKLPDTEIVYTRSDDTFIPLEERTHIANDIKADLFVSIHANSSPDHGARGVETYYLNLRGSPEAMEVAARENAAGQGNIHDLEDMVKKIARTEKIDESKELAEDIQDSLSKRIQKTAKPVKNRGVRKAPFVVLIGADMPSILTEISFLSNPADEQLLKKPEHRQHIAEGVFAGMTSYLQSLNSMSATGKPRPAPISPVEQSRNQN